MLEWLFTNQQSLAKENCSFQFDCFNVLRLCLQNTQSALALLSMLLSPCEKKSEHKKGPGKCKISLKIYYGMPLNSPQRVRLPFSIKTHMWHVPWYYQS